MVQLCPSKLTLQSILATSLHRCTPSPDVCYRARTPTPRCPCAFTTPAAMRGRWCRPRALALPRAVATA
eukprot:1161044-Pelagomonas_calceolata.AAC.8